ncbi:TPA: 5'-nucleotidase C-terminal domain-containing protein [Streptococcus agalactiae]
MSKHYFSKSVFALTVLTATATSGLAVQAEDIVTTPSSTATKVESTTPTSTIAEEKSNVTSTPTAITDASTATSTNTTANNQNPQPVATETTTGDLKPIEGEKVDLRIMSTTDLHTNLVNYDYYQDKESQKIGLAKTADERIIALAKEAHDGTINYVRQQVGTTTAPITSYFALVKDDPSVQIVNNAQRWYVANELKGTPEANLPLLSAAAPFKAGTRGDATAYTDIPAGPVAIKNVADLYLYDNVTALLKVTGADLREWLEMSAGQFNQIDPNNKAPQNIINTEYRTYNFDVIDGLTYKFDITQPNKYNKDGKVVNSQASRVRDLMYNGKPVADKQEFMIVTNNYRASGTFPGAKNATMNRLLNLENRQTIINYIISEKTINPTADNNWGFTESIKGLDLRFQTADKAKNLVTNSKDIQYIASSTKDEGFGDYRFVYTEQEKVDLTEPSHQEKLSQIEKQKIHHMVATAYTKAKASPNITGTVYTQQKEKTLPKTGQEKQSYLAFFGVAILGLVGSLLKKKQI